MKCSNSNRLFVSLILIAVSIGLAHGCGRETKIPTETGVQVTEERRSGKDYYRITSIGRASEIAIQKDSYAMKQSSSCDSARMMARRKIQELTFNPSASERQAESLGFDILDGGMYCKGTYLLPKG